MTQRACARQGAACSWEVKKAHVDELRGKAAEKRTKATLTDGELLALIDHVEFTRKRPDWANVLKVLAVCGLRPVELAHLTAKAEHSDRKCLWVSYRKTCGGAMTAPRLVDPQWLRKSDGEPVVWNIFELIQSELLEIPIRRDGGKKDVSASPLGQYLKSFVPIWTFLEEEAESKDEWLRTGDTFCDSYSLRCHQRGVEMGAIAKSIGHSLILHNQSYF